MTTYYVYDGQSLVLEETKNLDGTFSPSASYLNGPRGPEYKKDETTGLVKWYLYDGLGSVVGEVDPSGNVVYSAKYDVYAGVTDTFSAPYLSDDARNTSGFGPDAQDGVFAPAEDAKGFDLLQPVLLGARWYSPGGYGVPTLSRFLTRDPSGYAGGMNLYAYADNNPVNESDPSGLNPDDDEGGILGNTLLGPDTSAGSEFNGAANNFANSSQFQPGSQQRQDISNLLQQIPGVGTALSGYIALTGCDPVAGAPVAPLERGLCLLTALAPMLEALGEARECGTIFGCFGAGTPVLMADGTHKPIQDIMPGEWVQSANERTGEVEARQVQATTSHPVSQVMALTLTDARTGAKETLTCTPNHPFYVDGKGFTPAGSLGIGTSIVTRAGPQRCCLQVSDVQFERAGAGDTQVYNLTVEGDHTYFVGTVGGGAWVHNIECRQLKLFPTEKYSRRLHYGYTPTAAQRRLAGVGMIFDHNPPLVQHYYEGDGRGGIAGFNMSQEERRAFGDSLANGSAATPASQDAQGQVMSRYSIRKAKDFGL